ncbi:MAG TPA: helix-turn-helix domain-containing protein [Pseudonocardia sp.]|nr:helix-turn-helix domain-containing protein [Pseudonocardia sp.]
MARGASRTHVVAVLAVHGAPVVELAVPRAVFGAARPSPARVPGTTAPWYEVRPFDGDLDQLADAATVVVAGAPGVPPAPSVALRRALRAARARGARLVAVGSGTFVLAAAGVLARRRATTHWSAVDDLRRHHPDVLVDGAALYTEDDGILTCAGAAATLDLCLELVRQDHGAAVAHALGRWMVAPPHRAAGQQQLVATPRAEQQDDLAPLLEWASARLDRPLSLADLAQAAGVSPRTLARRFHAALGTTPLQWLLTQRIRLAQELLESTEHPVEQIAGLSGLGSAGNLRQQFARALGVSPQRYRRQFRASRR